jgi:hypothetical protein
MRDVLAAAGTAVVGAISCLAILLTVAIVGLFDLAAFGTNLAIAAILALVAVWIVRQRQGGEAEASGDRDG